MENDADRPLSNAQIKILRHMAEGWAALSGRRGAVMISSMRVGNESMMDDLEKRGLVTKTKHREFITRHETHNYRSWRLTALGPPPPFPFDKKQHPKRRNKASRKRHR